MDQLLTEIERVALLVTLINQVWEISDGENWVPTKDKIEAVLFECPGLFDVVQFESQVWRNPINVRVRPKTDKVSYLPVWLSGCNINSDDLML